MGTASLPLNRGSNGAVAGSTVDEAAPQQRRDADRPPQSMTEKAQKDAAALRNALAFTQAVGVLMRSEHYRNYKIGDLEWLLIPPLMAGQFRIVEARLDNKYGGGTLPVAIVLWANVSSDVDKRLMESETVPFELKPEDWKSGDILWLIHAAGETRYVRSVVAQLAKTTFSGREIKVLAADTDGKSKVHVLKPSGAN